MNSSLNPVLTAAREAGGIHNHPLSFVEEKQYSQTMKYHLLYVVNDLQRSLTVWKDTIAEFSQKVLEMETSLSWQDMDRCLKIAVASESLISFPEDWTLGDDLSALTTQLQSMQQHYQKQEEERKYLSEYYNELFLDQDGMQLQETFQQNQALGFFKRMSANRKFMKLLDSFAVSRTDKERVVEDLSHLVSYQREKSALDQQYASIQSQLRSWDNGVYISDGVVHYEELLGRMKEAKTVVGSFDVLAMNQSIREKVIQNKAYLKSSEVYETVGEDLEKAEQEYSQLLSTESVPEGVDYYHTMMKRLSTLKENLDKIHEWISWNCVAADARGHHLNPVIEAIEQGSALEKIIASYKKNLSKAIVIAELDHIDVLRQFSGMLFNEQIKRFRKLNLEMQKVSREEIFCRLAQKVPDATREASQNSELGILQRAIRSRGRGVSIRKLFGEIPNVLPRLCPCMLMSPMSAAQYLDPSREPFDVVIFDEASQLTTSKAVGAIARGKSAVIVGDPKQMPPTSFFMTNAVDEDHLEDEDLESILDDCLALGMPQTHLLWHYRSRHESLIRFSNSQFYGNKLYTFPSVNDEEKKVRLVHVNGVFDRGKTRCNEAEASATVAEIRKRALNTKLRGQSIGVVTFNTQQQGLIQDLFDDACDHDSRLNEWNAKAAEPVFIKNLESVQGDERDVIIFSIGYGPDKTGKVTMNFGPLNREGGWRRLNVAVSRARMEMIVISTLQPSQMDLSRTSSNGVRQLKAFLEYAKTGSLPLQEQAVSRKGFESSGTVGDICQELRRNGYQVRTRVGYSKFHIDIGVVDPGNDEKYLAGILLDGEQYADAKTTSDRELSQVNILNGLGWKIYRIWTLDWWDNKKRETERLIQFLNTLEEESTATENESDGTASEENNTRETTVAIPSENASDDRHFGGGTAITPFVPSKEETVIIEEKIASNHFQNAQNGEAASVTQPYGHGHLFQPTDITEVTYLQDLNTYHAYEILEKKIRKVLETEAPVSQPRLVRTVLASVGSRLGKKFVIDVANRMQVPVSQEAGVIYYWNFAQNKDEYKEYRINGIHKRNIKDVPECEIINAANDILNQQVALPEEELIIETARILGYKRIGENVKDTVAWAISHAIQRGSFKQDNNGKIIL